MSQVVAYPPTRSNRSLDGLRTIAMCGVLAYHFRLLPKTYTYPGGVFGVDLFFVLSGYLITGLLLREWDRSSTINVLQFYRRRAQRLYPALIVMLLGFISMQWWLGRLSPSIWREVLFGLSGIINVAKTSLGITSKSLAHLWSLCVELHFCIWWPLLCRFGLTRKQNSNALVPIFFSLILATILLRFTLLFYGVPGQRLYLMSSLRFEAFATGGLLAIFLKNHKEAFSRASALFGVIGLTVHLILAVILNKVPYHTGSPWAPTAVVLTCAAIIFGIAGSEKNMFSRVFSWWPLPQLGVCSYGVYLWHYPLIHVVPPAVSKSWTGKCILLSLTIALGFASYHLIEKRLGYKRLPSARDMEPKVHQR
jgi:peptidoglycan/LPS O-acetylase OafA/YrhL